MDHLFLIFETRGLRSSELDRLIKINGFAQAIKNTARVESVTPRSSYLDSGKFLPEVDLKGIESVVVLGSTYSEILLAALMRLSDLGVRVFIMPELIALLDTDSNKNDLSSAVTTILGEDCFVKVGDFVS